ncbi:putative serine protease F56F10.1 [Uranotaenia lowii]|uniref:putative serine protease F56F10.1 n=1 Tax=Uranotaenia lowii TaxID=190385 RepID=UPI00247AB903|nr:putative serine protease F56F10.1 [Uranotaenia lowii]
MKTFIVLTIALVSLAVAGKIELSKDFTASQKQQIDVFLGNQAISKPENFPTKLNEHIVEREFTTRVDHFNLQRTDTWTARYLVNPEHYLPGGPILILLGGNGDIDPFYLGEGNLIYDIAEALNGVVIAYESRFYGDSHVGLEDTSLENLRLLNLDQMLADLAEFVQHVKEHEVDYENTNVLVAGSGLGGALATWFRVRYPHLAQGLWSSSGFHRASIDYYEFAEAWSQTLIDFGSQQCYNDIFVAFHVMENLFDAGYTEVINDRFNLCTPIEEGNELQLQFFLSQLMGYVEGGTLLAQNVSSFDQVCAEITGADVPTSLDAFARWFNENFFAEGCALSSLEDFAQLFSGTAWDHPAVRFGNRQVFYQRCTEVGWFRTANSQDQPFGNRISVDMYAETCRRVFGDWFTVESLNRNAERTNTRFGGDSPVISNAHFVNGAEHPWRTVSIVDPRGPDTSAQMIPRELLSADLWSISEQDSDELREAKLLVKEKVTEFMYPRTPRV